MADDFLKRRMREWLLSVVENGRVLDAISNAVMREMAPGQTRANTAMGHAWDRAARNVLEELARVVAAEPAPSGQGGER